MQKKWSIVTRDSYQAVAFPTRKTSNVFLFICLALFILRTLDALAVVNGTHRFSSVLKYIARKWVPLQNGNYSWFQAIISKLPQHISALRSRTQFTIQQSTEWPCGHSWYNQGNPERHSRGLNSPPVRSYDRDGLAYHQQFLHAFWTYFQLARSEITSAERTTSFLWSRKRLHDEVHPDASQFLSQLYSSFQRITDAARHLPTETSLSQEKHAARLSEMQEETFFAVNACLVLRWITSRLGLFCCRRRRYASWVSPLGRPSTRISSGEI